MFKDFIGDLYQIRLEYDKSNPMNYIAAAGQQRSCCCSSRSGTAASLQVSLLQRSCCCNSALNIKSLYLTDQEL
jgi:hypothetical protein